MQGKVTIVSGDAARGLMTTLEEISKQNTQLIADNEQFKANDERFKAENEELKRELAKPKTLTGKVLSWFKKEA